MGGCTGAWLQETKPQLPSCACDSWVLDEANMKPHPPPAGTIGVAFWDKLSSLSVLWGVLSERGSKQVLSHIPWLLAGQWCDGQVSDSLLWDFKSNSFALSLLLFLPLAPCPLSLPVALVLAVHPYPSALMQKSPLQPLKQICKHQRVSSSWVIQSGLYVHFLYCLKAFYKAVDPGVFCPTSPNIYEVACDLMVSGSMCNVDVMCFRFKMPV